MDGLPDDGSSFPPVTLKAKFLDLLESGDKSLEALAKVLRIDISRYGDTVCELVSNYEQRFGQLSLRKWKYILQRLGYLEYFQQHVAADQIITDATDIDDLDDLDDEPSQAVAKQWSRNELGGRSFSSNSPVGRSLPVRTHLQGKHKSLKYQSKEFGPKDDQGSGKSRSCDGSTVHSNEINMNAMTEGTVKMMKKTNQASRKWPEWSLPPPENKKESTVDQGATKDCNDPDPTLDVSTESGFFSDTLHENNITPSNVLSLSPANSSPLSLVPKTETDKSQCEDVTVPKAEREEEESTASALHTDSSQEQSDKITTSSRPTTPEATCSSRNPLVTGHRSWQNNPGAEARLPLGNDEQLENNIDHDEESGNPTENYDSTENNGLLTELQKELRKKNSVCTALLTQGCHLQRQLEETRGQCAQLQRTVEEHERRLEESTVLEAESQRLMRMTHELNILKQQECERLEGHIRQMDQRYDNANCRMENLSRENQEMSEELQSAIGEVRDLLQERGRNLETERERLRVDNESQLEERMAELAQAFDNAETDEVKRLNQSLAMEKSKTKQLEEENGVLVEENHQLRALVKQLRSKEEGSVPSGDSCKDDVGENHESNSSASNEVEANEQPESLIYSEHSDSDCSEDELFEDAREEFDSS
ncbi:uncharacterized protein LOC144658148 isoform X2 [Oculina patagonica]